MVVECGYKCDKMVNGLVNNRKNRDWFTMVEIEINSNCNRGCPYCPSSKLKRPNIPLYMDNNIFDRIINELQEINFSGRISYHFYGEPLLHPELDDIVENVSKALPQSRQVLYTNGDLLTEEKYLKLRKLGISHFVVTSHDSKPFPSRPAQTVLYPKDLHITYRGGIVGALSKPLTLPCCAPSTMLIVTISGDILLCYEDAKREHVMGNIMHQSLEDIWFSPMFSYIREQLASGNRDVAGICRICNNTAHTKPITFDYVL